ncbi:MAG TPA: alpha/beta hydrolase [Xanthobacteraceae bacterium]|jgi:pimeloyl-ACP methyl ester carboxylesterase|nr:alpha/beta hydrolase [Xanthobacteraceae bacterium]
MRRFFIAALTTAALATTALAAVKPFSSAFIIRDIAANGTLIHVRVGGHGPAVVLLHGFGDTGDMWQPLAAQLVTDHLVIVPDLRGMGLSAHPDTGYTKKNEAADIAGVLEALHITHLALVTHDIGNMVGYAFVVQHPDMVSKWVAMDAPLPGLGHWDDLLKDPRVWHFNFYGPDEERLVAGRERIYLDRFYDELSADPKRIDEPTREHYATLYARPHAMHDAFEQFKAFPQDAKDNQGFVAHAGKLQMPVLAIGGAKSFGAQFATEIGSAADHVQSAVIADSGHWLMEEQPAATMSAIEGFLAKQ